MIAQGWPRPRRGAWGYAETGTLLLGKSEPSLLPGAVELPHKVVGTINGAALVGALFVLKLEIRSENPRPLRNRSGFLMKLTATHRRAVGGLQRGALGGWMGG
jgi:hypothetical protein